MNITIIYRYIIKYMPLILLLLGFILIIYSCIPFRTKKINVPITNYTSIPTSEIWIENYVLMEAGEQMNWNGLFKPVTYDARFWKDKQIINKIDPRTSSFTTTPISLWAFPWNKPSTRGKIKIYNNQLIADEISYNRDGYFDFNYKLKDGLILKEYPIQINFTKLPIIEIIRERVPELNVRMIAYIELSSHLINLDSKILAKEGVQQVSIFIILPKIYANKLDDIKFKLNISYGGGGNILLVYDKNTKLVTFDESVESYESLAKLNYLFIGERASRLAEELKYDSLKELWKKYNYNPDAHDLDWLLYRASYPSYNIRNLPDFKLNQYLTIKFLLEKGANPNAKIGSNDPILCYVIGSNNLEAVKCMLEHGANIQIACSLNPPNRPSEWAAWFKFKELEMYLKEKEKEKEMDSK